jgi:hypothetical protein
MKNILLTTIAITGLAVSVYGQGFIYLDGSANSDPSSTATSNGQVFINGVNDTGTDINVELLGGSTALTMTPIITLLLSDSSPTNNPTGVPGGVANAAGDITAVGGAGPYDLSGQFYQVPGVPVGNKGYFEILGWLGGNTFAGATLYTGMTATFNETTCGSSPPFTVLDQMPALDLSAVPEPTTMALLGLSGLSLLLFRRRN